MTTAIGDLQKQYLELSGYSKAIGEFAAVFEDLEKQYLELSSYSKVIDDFVAVIEGHLKTHQAAMRYLLHYGMIVTQLAESGDLSILDSDYFERSINILALKRDELQFELENVQDKIRDKIGLIEEAFKTLDLATFQLEELEHRANEQSADLKELYTQFEGLTSKTEDQNAQLRAKMYSCTQRLENLEKIIESHQLELQKIRQNTELLIKHRDCLKKEEKILKENIQLYNLKIKEKEYKRKQVALSLSFQSKIEQSLSKAKKIEVASKKFKKQFQEWSPSKKGSMCTMTSLTAGHSV